MSHDDGKKLDDVAKADIVILGVSRTSKTPTSMYLANRGIRTANVPMVPNVSLPPNIFSSKVLIIGLTTSPDRLIQIRKSRLNSVGEKRTTNYIEEDVRALCYTIIKNICTAYDLVNWSSINLVFESSLSYLLNVILS